ncbi:BlaI/MecI/CopY family transcriptional regulator [Streptomyces sp. NBC_00648]|uniref:BlaI/MecI/CopY family transcriptional regulator n=1 Tax=Streptomyces sp. NBC_00648 TaxID=2975797 RepID=UPI0032549DF4
MADEPDTTTLKDQYAARVTADLDANQQDQSRIRAELDTLKGQLEDLERDHGLLQTMHHTLTGAPSKAAPTKATPARSVPAKAAAPAKVPTPRTKKPEVKAAAAKPAQAPRKNTAPAKTASRGKAETSGPTLREVVLGLFAGHQEPRTVSDILTELTTAHPDRTTSPQVVRNTLEALVAKGELERERKQGSVFYTARTDKTSAVTPTAGTVPAKA